MKAYSRHEECEIVLGEHDGGSDVRICMLSGVPFLTKLTVMQGCAEMVSRQSSERRSIVWMFQEGVALFSREIRRLMQSRRGRGIVVRDIIDIQLGRKVTDPFVLNLKDYGAYGGH